MSSHATFAYQLIHKNLECVFWVHGDFELLGGGCRHCP